MATKQGIEHRLLKTTAVSWLSTLISIVVQLISVPICLNYWGKSGYGAWLALTAAFTIMRTIDGGYTAYVGNQLNILYHKSDFEVRQVLASSIWGVLWLGIIQMVVLLIIYKTNTMHWLIHTNASMDSSFQIMIGLMIMSLTWMLTGSYIGILHRFLIPVGMLYQLLWWMMLLQAAQYLSLMLAAFCQVSIIKAAVFSSIVQASVYLSSAIYIKKKLPQYFPWVKSPSGSIAMRDIIRSIPMSINGIMQQGGNSALIMLISAIISTAAVPAYATLRTLTNLGTTVANIVTAPLLPDIIRFHSIEDGKRLLMVHRAHILLISVVINIPILIFFPVINSIFEVWTKHKLILDHALLGCLLASVVIFSINSLFNTFLNGLNHKNYLIMSASIRGVLVFILGLVFMPYLHLKGLGIAILLAELVLLWINCQKFFKPELAKINCHNVSLFSKWNWLGYGAIFVFLIVDSMLTQINWYSYTITWVLCLTSIIFTWKELDIEIKIRLISLFKKPTKKAN